MADDKEEAISEEVSIDAAEDEEDTLARLEAKIDALITAHEERIARLEAGAGGYAAAEHQHDYAGTEHEHGGKTEEREPESVSTSEAGEPRETAPRSSHWYYRSIGEHFHK